MIAGLGTDVQSILQVSRILDKHGEKFLDKVLTKREKDYCLNKLNPKESIAGKWAAKEAAIKSLTDTSFKVFNFLDVEIINSPRGKPYVLFKDQKIHYELKFFLSVSHSEDYAAATCIAEGNDLQA